MKIHDFLTDASNALHGLSQLDVRQSLREKDKRRVTAIGRHAPYSEKVWLAIEEIDAGRLIDFAAAPFRLDSGCTVNALAGMGLINPPLPTTCMLLSIDREATHKILLVEADLASERRKITILEASHERNEFVALRPLGYVQAGYTNRTYLAHSKRGPTFCQGTMALVHTALAFLSDNRSKVIRHPASNGMQGYWKVDHTASAVRLPHESADQIAKHMTRGSSFFETL